ncbi:MAG: DMT family transporter [Caldisericia bacterium]
MNNKKSPVADYLILVAGVLGICFAPPLIKIARSHGVSVFATAFWRIAVGAVFVAFIGKPWQIKANLKSIFLAVLAGIFMALHFVVWVWSFDYVSVAVSVVLVTTVPIFVVAFEYIFLKNKPTSKTVFGVALAMIGAIIVSVTGLSSGFGQILGSLLALAGALTAACFFFLSKLAQREMISWQTISVMFITAAFVMLIFLPFTGVSLVGFDKTGWFAVILMGLLSQLIGQSALNISVTRLSTTITTTAVLFEPVGASILAWFMFRETITPLVFVGGVVIILGVWLTNKKQKLSK